MERRDFLSLSALAVPAVAGARSPMPAGTVLTRVETAQGSFVIAVNLKQAPVTVANYLAYVDNHWLDHGSVYRIVTIDNQPKSPYKIEVVQWGMNAPDDKPPPTPAIAHETTQQTGLRHLDGTVSMARNQPGTASSEFFICIGDQPELDFGGHRNPDGQGFAAFGQVVQGESVVRAIYRQGGRDQLIKKPIPIQHVGRISQRS